MAGNGRRLFGKSEMRKIDAHAHVGEFGSWCGVAITAAEMAREMGLYGIERAIVSYPDNRVALDAQECFPGKLCALAWMNPTLPSAADEFRYLSGKGSVSGLKLHPLFNAYTANDECVFPLMEEAVLRDLPVFVHSGHPPFSLPWSIGQLAREFPKARVVMVHMGHGHGVYIQAAIDVARTLDNVWLENSGMPMHTKIAEAYRRVGSGRIFWGSDVPFHHYAVEILRTEVSGLDRVQLEDVFYWNIAKFMGWERQGGAPAA
ncbi:MAG: amidohydrolase family protein [Deltaproteobacteria bacterium]|jgi:predicted TIM-barrel fold metal-dependent hydrolase|nr:amidohydrolase family protein [Deltaproteobacteria bacterium]